MKNKILLLATAATLAFTATSYASSVNQSNTTESEQKDTIMQNLVELKENLKDWAAVKADKFNQTVSDTYTQLSAQVSDLQAKIKDKKDSTVASLKDKSDDLNKAIEDYKAASAEKQETMRQTIVDKLNELNQNISDYNKSQQHSN